MAGCCCSSVFLSILVFSVVIFTSFHPVKTEENNIRLTEENWLQITEGEWMIKFYAPWCPACRNIAKTWVEFSDEAVKLGVKVADVDVTQDSGVSGRFMVSSLPTIYHVINGEYRKYSGKRSVKDFVDFVNEKKWKEIEPISSWKSPNSFMMGGMGYLLKLSAYLRDAHVLLTETYGLPAWGSYAVFGLATVLTGLLLGVLIVVVTDMVYKPEYSGPPPPTEPAPGQVLEEPSPDETPQDDKQPNDEMDVEEEENMEKTVEATEEEALVVEEKEEDQETESNELLEQNEETTPVEKESVEADETDVAGEKDDVPDEKNTENSEEVDEVIEDKEEDDGGYEHTEVRKRKPKASAD